MTSSPFDPPTTDFREPPRPWLCWALWGCGGALVLFLLALGSCALLLRQVSGDHAATYTVACETYFIRKQSCNYKRCYEAFGPELKGVLSEVAYIAKERAIDEKLGALKGLDFLSTGSGIDAKGRWGQMFYRGHFEKAEAVVRFDLRYSTGELRIIGVFYDSSALLEPTNAGS